MRFKTAFITGLVVMALSNTPIQAQEWLDGTHIFEEETRRLADTVTKETVAEFDLRTKGILQYVDQKPPEIGDEITLNTFNIAEQRSEPVQAILKKIGTHCYIYLEKGQTVSPAIIEKIAKVFDEKIYPTDTSYFGSEWSPGIDGDPKITLFLLDIRDGFKPKGPSKGFIAGYFYSGDEYHKEKNPSSNEREMLYLDLSPADPTKEKYLSVVAHEFQHMIHWHKDPKEYSWVNEGMSQLSSFLNGYGHPSQILAFMKSPDNSLLGWRNENTIANYGEVYLFFYYLMDQMTSSKKDVKELTQAIVASKGHGAAGIAAALKKTGQKETFSEIFRNFWVANFINNKTVANGEYGYDKALGKFRLEPMKIHKSPPFEGKATVFPWSARAVKFDISRCSGSLKIRFAGKTQVSQGKRLNSFDVGIAFTGGTLSKKASVKWLSSEGNKCDQSIEIPKGSEKSLYLIVCNRGPEDKTEASFAKAAPPVEFAYSITPSKYGAGISVASSQKARVSRRTMNTMIENIANQLEQLGEISPNLSDEAVAAQLEGGSYLAQVEQINEEENLIVDSIQSFISKGDLTMLQDFFGLYNSSNDSGKKNLESLRRKILDMLRFEVMQNHREDLKSFLSE